MYAIEIERRKNPFERANAPRKSFTRLNVQTPKNSRKREKTMDNSYELMTRPKMDKLDAIYAQDAANDCGLYFTGTPQNADISALNDIFKGVNKNESGKLDIAFGAYHFIESKQHERMTDANGNAFKSAKAAYTGIENKTGIAYTTFTQYAKITEKLYKPYMDYQNSGKDADLNGLTANAAETLVTLSIGVLIRFIPCFAYSEYINILSRKNALDGMTARKAGEFSKAVKAWEKLKEDEISVILAGIVAETRDIFGVLKNPENDVKPAGKVIDIDSIWDEQKGVILTGKEAEKADLNAVIAKQGTDLDAVENNLNVQTAALQKALDVKPEKAGNIRLDGIEIPANHTRLTIENSDLNITLDVDGMDEKAIIAVVKGYFKQLKDAAK